MLHQKCRCETYETGIFCLNNPVFDRPLTLCNPIYYTFYLRSSNFSVVSYMICFLWPYNMELTALRPEFLRIGLLHQGTFDYIVEQGVCAMYVLHSLTTLRRTLWVER